MMVNKNVVYNNFYLKRWNLVFFVCKIGVVVINGNWCEMVWDENNNVCKGWMNL